MCRLTSGGLKCLSTEATVKFHGIQGDVVLDMIAIVIRHIGGRFHVHIVVILGGKNVRRGSFARDDQFGFLVRFLGRILELSHFIALLVGFPDAGKRKYNSEIKINIKIKRNQLRTEIRKALWCRHDFDGCTKQRIRTSTGTENI